MMASVLEQYCLKSCFKWVEGKQERGDQRRLQSPCFGLRQCQCGLNAYYFSHPEYKSSRNITGNHYPVSQSLMRCSHFTASQIAESHNCGKQLCVSLRVLTSVFLFRAHINDMENILPFLFLGAIYSMTGPSLWVARLHFLVFFICRVLHSVAYLLALQAPTRSVAYTLAQIPCVSMAVQILMAVKSYA